MHLFKLSIIPDGSVEFVAHYEFDCEEKLRMIEKCGIFAVNLASYFLILSLSNS